VPSITGSFDDVKAHNESLIRKMLELSIYLGPWPSAPDIQTVTDTSGTSLVIPDTYRPGGMVSKDDGVSLTPSQDMSEVGAYGYGAAVRRDISNRSLELSFTMLQSMRLTFELYNNLDLTGVAAPAGKQELKWDAPDRPDARYWRALIIGRDGQGVRSIFNVEFLPKVILTDVEAIAWSEDEPVAYGVTLAADHDSQVGTSQRSFWAGPGLTPAMITAMGFTQAA
jgi:hypothetical protein